MNKHSISLVLIFIGLLIVAVIVSSLNSDETNKDPKSSIKWDNDYNHAIQVAKIPTRRYLFTSMQIGAYIAHRWMI